MRPAARRAFWMVVSVLAPIGGGHGALHAQEALEHCALAEEFLVQGMGMVARMEPDTISDWRTGRRVPGCRITAAGLAPEEIDEVKAFYAALESEGWTRTPNPRDAPREGSMRFRREGSDCLFNFYHAGYLGTSADLDVSNEVVPGPGQDRYNLFVMCQPAMDASRR